MITRKRLKIITAIRFSWRNLLFSFLCALTSYIIHIILGVDHVSIPPGVVAILGGALAIILAFRNASAYERWWEARSIWGRIVNESRTFTRQALTVVDPDNIPKDLLDASYKLVRGQIAFVNALRLQLRETHDLDIWSDEVGRYFSEEEYAEMMKCTNKVTQIGIHQGKAIKELNAKGVLDTFSYIQIDDTLTRITALQGDCERIKWTPMPRPYDYYTRAFLILFILFFPFGLVDTFWNLSWPWLIMPVTMVTGWIFYQIYVFANVLSRPFDDIATDIPMKAITTDIEIDLKETIGGENVPRPIVPINGIIR